MFLAVLVVTDGPALDEAGHVLGGKDAAGALARVVSCFHRGGDGLQQPEAGPCVPFAEIREHIQGSGRQLQETVQAEGFSQGPFEQHPDVGRSQGREHEQARARDQGAVDLEAGILGGGPDEGHVAAFDPGQQGVLLGLVETMDFVEKEDRAGAGGPFQPGRLAHDLLEDLRSHRNGTVFDKAGPGVLGGQSGQGGLAAARGTPQKERGKGVTLDEPPERSALTKQFGLPYHFIKGGRTHAIGQGGVPGRFGAVRCTRRVGGAVEEIILHARHFSPDYS